MADDSKAKSDKMAKVIDNITAVILICMMLAALSQVFFRFVLKVSVPWTEELARIFYVYIIFLGLILLESEDYNMKVTFLVDKLPFIKRWRLQIILNILSILFLICLFIGALIMFRNSNTMNFGTMPFLKISILYIPILISCPLTSYYLIKQLFNFKLRDSGVDEDVSQGKSSITEEGTK